MPTRCKLEKRETRDQCRLMTDLKRFDNLSDAKIKKDKSKTKQKGTLCPPHLVYKCLRKEAAVATPPTAAELRVFSLQHSRLFINGHIGKIKNEAGLGKNIYL